MQFHDKIYPRPVVEMILDGSKCQTRRLVKETDMARYAPKRTLSNELVGEICDVVHKKRYRDKKGKITHYKLIRKWQLGKSYSVQFGRGKPGLWYCKACNVVMGGKWNHHCPAPESHPWNDQVTGDNKHVVSLRITITSIHKERLMSISHNDVDKEGFAITEEEFQKDPNNHSKRRFFEAFYKLHKRKEKLYGCGSCTKVWGFWNPEVWVLDFSVKRR